MDYPNIFISSQSIESTFSMNIFICRNVFWNETGNLVCLATEDCYFILQVDTGAIAAAIEAKQGLGEDGLEDAFDVSFFLNVCCLFRNDQIFYIFDSNSKVLGEIPEQVKTGLWVS